MTKKFKAVGVFADLGRTEAHGQSILFKVHDSEKNLFSNEFFSIGGSLNSEFLRHVKEYFGGDLKGLNIEIILSK